MKSITTQLPFKGIMSSNIGGRAENQDTCGFSETGRGLLLVVCDGMGGGPGGKTASYLATSAIISFVQKAEKPALDDPTAVGPATGNETLLTLAVKAANKALRDKIAEKPELDGMGTTVTAVLLSPQGATIAHVGDSRVYQLRKNRIVFRTADHSRVAEMVRAGALSEEQARLSAISNLITRALGIGDDVQVDVSTVSYQKGDRFVLCTDGVWGAFPQPALVKAQTAGKTLEATAEGVNAQVEAAGQEKGGHHDNYTMIIAEALEGSRTPVKETAKMTPNETNDINASKGKFDIRGIFILSAIVTGILVAVGLVPWFIFSKPTTEVKSGDDENTVKTDSVANVSEPTDSMPVITMETPGTTVGDKNTRKVVSSKQPVDSVSIKNAKIQSQIDSLNYVITKIEEVNDLFNEIRDILEKNVGYHPSIEVTRIEIINILDDIDQNYRTILSKDELDWLFYEKLGSNKGNKFVGLKPLIDKDLKSVKNIQKDILTYANAPDSSIARVTLLLNSLNSRKARLKDKLKQ